MVAIHDVREMRYLTTRSAAVRQLKILKTELDCLFFSSKAERRQGQNTGDGDPVKTTKSTQKLSELKIETSASGRVGSMHRVTWNRIKRAALEERDVETSEAVAPPGMEISRRLRRHLVQMDRDMQDLSVYDPCPSVNAMIHIEDSVPGPTNTGET